MAIRQIAIMSCDVCGTEDKPIEREYYARGDRWYSTDLCAEHRDSLDAALAPFIAVSRREATGAPKRPKATRNQDGVDVYKARRWLMENGYHVSRNGKLSDDHIRLYKRSQP